MTRPCSTFFIKRVLSKLQSVRISSGMRSANIAKYALQEGYVQRACMSQCLMRLTTPTLLFRNKDLDLSTPWNFSTILHHSLLLNVHMAFSIWTTLNLEKANVANKDSPLPCGHCDHGPQTQQRHPLAGESIHLFPLFYSTIDFPMPSERLISRSPRESTGAVLRVTDYRVSKGRGPSTGARRDIASFPIPHPLGAAMKIQCCQQSHAELQKPDTSPLPMP